MTKTQPNPNAPNLLRYEFINFSGNPGLLDRVTGAIYKESSQKGIWRKIDDGPVPADEPAPLWIGDIYVMENDEIYIIHEDGKEKHYVLNGEQYIVNKKTEKVMKLILNEGKPYWETVGSEMKGRV